jgi:NAD dependent epimerase/dehydratase family enzyme
MNIIIIDGNNTIGYKISNILKENGFSISYIDIQEIENTQKFTAKLKNNDIICNLSYNTLLQNKVNDSSNYLILFNKLTDIVASLEKKPKLFISTSFTAIYNNNKDIHTEMDISYSNNYLSNISMDMENSISNLNDIGINSIIMRLPIVIDDDIFINKLKKYYKKRFFIKKIKNKNFLSWVSSNDIARAFYFIIKNKKLYGVFNIVSPKITLNQEISDFFKEKYGKSLIKLPYLFISKSVKNYIDLFSSLKVQPKRLLDNKFEFQDKILKDYLDKII